MPGRNLGTFRRDRRGLRTKTLCIEGCLTAVVVVTGGLAVGHGVTALDSGSCGWCLHVAERHHPAVVARPRSAAPSCYSLPAITMEFSCYRQLSGPGYRYAALEIETGSWITVASDVFDRHNHNVPQP